MMLVRAATTSTLVSDGSDREADEMKLEGQYCATTLTSRGALEEH